MALAGGGAAQAQRGGLVMASQVITAPWAAPSQRDPASLTEKPSYVPPPLRKMPPPAPLTEAERGILRSIVSEKLKEPTWLRYVVSNEWRHDVTFPRLAGLGGALIGVAADQNYTLAAAAGSEIVVLFDYDAEVRHIHRVYHEFIRQSPSAAELRALFDPAGARRANEILALSGASPNEVKQLQRVYNHYRERLRIYLRHVANLQIGERRPSWLGDAAAYAYVRGLVMAGRVVAVQGDLHGGVALRSVGQALAALKVPARLIYLSNAEAFFPYSQAFRDNLAALPHDERTVVLRTSKRGLPSPVGDMWHYNLHQLDDFLLRLMGRGYPTVGQVMAELRTPVGRKQVDPIGVSYLDGTVPIR